MWHQFTYFCYGSDARSHMLSGEESGPESIFWISRIWSLQRNKKLRAQQEKHAFLLSKVSIWKIITLKVHHTQLGLSICHCLNKFCPLIVLWLAHSFAFILFVLFFFTNYNTCFLTDCPHRKWGTIGNVARSGWGNWKGTEHPKPAQRRCPLPRKSNVLNRLPQGTFLPWSNWRIRRPSSWFSLGRQNGQGSWLQWRENWERTVKVALCELISCYRLPFFGGEKPGGCTMIQSCSLDGLPTCVLLFRWANRFIDNCQHFLLLRIPVSSPREQYFGCCSIRWLFCY